MQKYLTVHVKSIHISCLKVQLLVVESSLFSLIFLCCCPMNDIAELHVSTDAWLYSRLWIAVRQSLPGVHGLQQSQFQRKGTQKLTKVITQVSLLKLLLRTWFRIIRPVITNSVISDVYI